MRSHYTVKGSYNGTIIRRLIKVKEDLRVNNISPDYMGEELMKKHWYSQVQADNRTYTFGYKKCFMPRKSIQGTSNLMNVNFVTKFFQILLDIIVNKNRPVGYGPCAKVFKGESCFYYPSFVVYNSKRYWPACCDSQGCSCECMAFCFDERQIKMTLMHALKVQLFSNLIQSSAETFF